MKEETKAMLGALVVIAMFIFVGVAIVLNIQDSLTDSHYADGINLIGFAMVAVGSILLTLWLIMYKSKPCKRSD